MRMVIDKRWLILLMTFVILFARSSSKYSPYTPISAPAEVKDFSIATEVKVWELQDLGPLPHWNKGRTILIGEVAHTMTPI